MASKLPQFHIRVTEKTGAIIERIAVRDDISEAEVCRRLIEKGLAMEFSEEYVDVITKAVRETIQPLMKLHTERLASLSAKTGVASATAMFLNAQAFMDLVPPEKRKDVKSIYDAAKKKGVEYMRVPTDEFEAD